MQQDQTYKELFLQPEMLRALLEVYGPKGLAESLDFSTLEDIGTELLGSKGQKRQSDLIFKIRFQEKCFLYLILLLEVQQNQYRGLLVLRMLEYITLIWKKISDKEKDSKTLPPVLPILLHTGHQSFTRPTSIQEILSPYPKFLARFQPSFEFFLVDEFSQQAKARKLFDPASVLFLANHADTIENYQLAIQRMQTLLLDEKLGTIVEQLARWLVKISTKHLPEMQLRPEDIQASQLKESLIMVQNRFEKMRQTEYEKGIIFGVQQGVQQGMQQGVQQGMQQSLQILESLYSNGTLSIKDVREQAQKLMGKGCDSLVEKFLISLK